MKKSEKRKILFPLHIAPPDFVWCLADNEKCDVKAVEDIDGVKGVFSASGQVQIILGTGVVNKVYDEFLACPV